MSRVVYKASCWDCQDFYYTGKTKQRLHDRKMEHFINPLRVSLSSWQDSFAPGIFLAAERPCEASGEATREYPLEYSLFLQLRRQNNTALPC